MRAVEVYRNNNLAGILTETSQRNYVFKYNNAYFNNTQQPAVSLTLPKTQQEYQSTILFPFFFNMLSEGVNKKIQSLQLKIDENDYFGLLMATAQFDTIGAVSIKPL
ncbi:MAG: HipA N-terminal domain-containing protein [Lutibacter sp.]|nr:HipA N-terminal domain-containing protein [Lutibacter sp.]MBP9600983.1 HipA N-terminal domain-containing protein [Lutibacter sp.]